MTGTRRWKERAAGPQDREVQAELFNACFGKAKDAATFEWKYARNPDGPALSSVACDEEGRVVGGYSYMPRRFLRDGRPLLLMQASDAMTLPDWRGQGIFTGLDDVVAERAGRLHVPLAWAYSGRQSLHGFQKNGWRIIGQSRLYRRLFRSRRALSRQGRLGPLLAGLAPLVDPFLAAGDRSALSAAGRSLTPLQRFDTRVDRLFDATAPRVGLVGVRSASWLNWRYVDTPTRRQECWALLDGPSLLGYAVGEFVGGQAWLVDHWAADERARSRLLLAFTELAHARGLDEASALLCDHHPAVPVLLACGWRSPRKSRSFRDIFPFIVRCCRADAPDEDLQLGRWHLADGDRDAEHMSP